MVGQLLPLYFLYNKQAIGWLFSAGQAISQLHWFGNYLVISNFWTQLRSLGFKCDQWLKHIAHMLIRKSFHSFKKDKFTISRAETFEMNFKLYLVWKYSYKGILTELCAHKIWLRSKEVEIIQLYAKWDPCWTGPTHSFCHRIYHSSKSLLLLKASIFQWYQTSQISKTNIIFFLN